MRAKDRQTFIYTHFRGCLLLSQRTLLHQCSFLSPCHRLGQELSSEQVSCITASPAVACHLPICCVICSSSSIYLLPNELSQHQNERFCCLLRRACSEFQFLDYYCLATSLFQAVSASPDRAFVCGSLVEKLYAFPVIKFNQPLPSFFF